MTNAQFSRMLAASHADRIAQSARLSALSARQAFYTGGRIRHATIAGIPAILVLDGPQPLPF